VCSVSEQSFLLSEKIDHESFTGAQQLKSLEQHYNVLSYCIDLNCVYLCKIEEEEDQEDVEEDKVQ